MLDRRSLILSGLALGSLTVLPIVYAESSLFRHRLSLYRPVNRRYSVCMTTNSPESNCFAMNAASPAEYGQLGIPDR
jgi:hypothetical protein